MSIQYVRRPDGLGEPLGRYSHVSISSGRIVTIAGQVGVTDDGALAAGGFAGEVAQAYQNCGHALAGAGATFQDVVKMTTFLVRAGDITEFMEVRAQVFADIYPEGEYPPNTLLVVSRLVEERFHIEIEASAALDPELRG